MSLRTYLYQFCEDKNIKELSCIIHFSIVNYVSSHKSTYEWVYLSDTILNSFIGLEKDIILDLFEYLSSKSTSIKKNYMLFCPEEKDLNYNCDSIEEEDFLDKDFEMSCLNCNKLHTVSEIKSYETRYIGNKKEILDGLSIANQDIIKEMLVLNTSSEHLDKLADIIVSRLDLNKENKVEAKSGILKILGSVKEVTGLISGIAGDVSSTSKSVKDIIEDFTGLSTLRDYIK